MQCTNAKLYTKLSLVQGRKSLSHTMHSFTVHKIPELVFDNLKLFDIRNIQVEHYHSYSFQVKSELLIASVPLVLGLSVDTLENHIPEPRVVSHNLRERMPLYPQGYTASQTPVAK